VQTISQFCLPNYPKCCATSHPVFCVTLTKVLYHFTDFVLRNITHRVFFKYAASFIDCITQHMVPVRRLCSLLCYLLYGASTQTVCKTASPNVLCHYIDCGVVHITCNVVPLHGLCFKVFYPPFYHLLTRKAFSSEEVYSNGSINVTSNRRISVKINREAVQLYLVNTSL